MRGRRAARPFRWDGVIKVGGSLGRSPGLRALLGRLARLAKSRRILLIPGGGRFADLVRAERARLDLDESSSHSMALRAMDQYGLLLAALCPGARATDDLAQARRIASAGRMPVLLSSRLVEGRRGLERSFRLTSDSIAAIVAERIAAGRLVLLKRCPCPGGALASRRALRRLARRGVVDPLFPVLAPRRCLIRVVDARRFRDASRLLPADGAPAAGRRLRRGGARPGSR